ncbi:hypothetical protein C8J57DRAFT_1650647 [Mycena rebaudengoi]|nr:hypothetical protein C8J57DRAFT_1650647 [Mycena rebaudengoi]
MDNGDEDQRLVCDVRRYARELYWKWSHSLDKMFDLITGRMIKVVDGHSGVGSNGLGTVTNPLPTFEATEGTVTGTVASLSNRKIYTAKWFSWNCSKLEAAVLFIHKKSYKLLGAKSLFNVTVFLATRPTVTVTEATQRPVSTISKRLHVIGAGATYHRHRLVEYPYSISIPAARINPNHRQTIPVMCPVALRSIQPATARLFAVIASR